MEDFRRKMAQDRTLYPNASSSNPRATNSVISVGSSSDGDEPVAKPRVGPRRPYLVSDDEEPQGSKEPTRSVDHPGHSVPKARAPFPSLDRAEPPTFKSSEPLMIRIPGSHRDQISKPNHVQQIARNPPIWAHPAAAQDPQIRAHPAATQDGRWETFTLPQDNHLYDPLKTAAEAEKDLRNLVEGNFDTRANDTIDEEFRKVNGFRDEIALLDHQVLGRIWMTDRETGKKMGGILADDMGLGKTIQTLTRILDHRPKKADREEGWAAPTLIVCPVSLVSQWASEIEKYCQIKLTVIEHHGSKRHTDPQRLKQSHVVITSYSVVASEYANYVPVKNAAVARQQSSDDDSEGDSEGPYNSRKKGTKAKTTSRKGKMDALFHVKWWRIVLDEAHTIKNRSTKAAQACSALKGKYRWCLTGTPMQNSVEELYSLIKFLQIKPLNDWQVFNEQIAKPVKSGKSVRAMKRLHVVLTSIMLRRRKDHIINGKPILNLPARNVQIVHCEFSKWEKEFYDAVHSKVEESLNKIMGQEKRNYTSILLLLLRLRQACNHPLLASKDYKIDSEALEPRMRKDDEDEDDGEDLAAMFGQMNVKTTTCQMCLQDITQRNKSNDPRFCTSCLPLASKARAGSDNELPPDSAKIRQTLRILGEIEERQEGEKTIIFSQFTSMLDLIQPFLKHRGIKYVRYDGSMSKDKREASLHQIRTSKSTRVILISFKAGSTGLNLTACNNVVLFDLWWNPALEDQAFDRTHRLGQTRDVNIHKLTIPSTVEERILALQEEKRELAKAALGGDKLKSMRLGMEELLALFKPGKDGEDEED